MLDDCPVESMESTAGADTLAGWVAATLDDSLLLACTPQWGCDTLALADRPASEADLRHRQNSVGSTFVDDERLEGMGIHQMVRSEVAAVGPAQEVAAVGMLEHTETRSSRKSNVEDKVPLGWAEAAVEEAHSWAEYSIPGSQRTCVAPRCKESMARHRHGHFHERCRERCREHSHARYHC